MPWYGPPRRYMSFGRRAYGARRTTSGWRTKKTYRNRLNPTTKIASAGTASRPDVVHFHNRHARLDAVECSQVNNTTIGQNFIGCLGARAFSIGDISNSGDFTNLYDWYKFGYVELIFTVTNAPVSADGIEEMLFGEWSLWIDTDSHDTTMPAAEGFLERGTVKMLHFDMRKGGTIKVKVKPSVLIPVWQLGVSSAYREGGQPWLSTQYPAVPHFGVKWMVRAPFNTTAAQPTIDAFPLVNIEANYYFACKKSK